MKCKNLYILLAFICLAVGLGAQADDCDSYILGLNEGGNTAKEKMNYLFDNDFASYTDEFNEHGRPFRYYDFYFLRTPDDGKQYYIKLYGTPFYENGERFVYYQKFQTAERDTLFDQNGLLNKMPYSYFESEVLAQFLNDYVQVGELVFYPTKESSFLKFEAYRVLSTGPTDTKVQHLVSGAERNIANKDLLFHSVSMLKTYGYFRAFYENGGKGSIVRYKSEFRKVMENNEFDIGSSHVNELHFIHVEKLPSPETKFESFFKMLDSFELHQYLQEIIGKGVPVLLTARGYDWSGLTTPATSLINKSISDTLGFKKSVDLIFLVAEADLSTAKHEITHYKDFVDGTKDKIIELSKEVSKTAKSPAFWARLARFIIEYRGYKTSYVSLIEQGDLAGAEASLENFKRLHSEPLRLAIAFETSKGMELEYVTKLLFSYCEPHRDFNIETTLIYSN